MRTLTPEQRAERLRAAHQQLCDSVEALTTEQGWQVMIQARAWLRRYSLNNLLMILTQCPHARDVRPLSEWNRLGRRVRKGERAIRIFAPRLRRRGPDGAETADAATADPERSDGEPSGPGGRAVIGFLLVNVFDVSQTEGAPLPASSTAHPVELTGDAPAALWDGIAAQIRAQGYALDRADCSPAYGRTRYLERTVSVRPGLAPAQAAKTLTHELAHILCQHGTRTDVSRETCEVEAESVACLLAAACGLDTLDYSVPYVAGWAPSPQAARDAAARVLAVADTILAALPTPQTAHAAVA